MTAMSLRLFALIMLGSVFLVLPGRSNAATSALVQLLHSHPDLTTMAEVLQSSQMEAVLQEGTLFAPTNEAFAVFMAYYVDYCKLDIANFSSLPLDVQQSVIRYHVTLQTLPKNQLCDQPEWFIQIGDHITSVASYQSVDGLNGLIQGSALKSRIVQSNGPNTCINIGDAVYVNFADVTFTLRDDYTHSFAQADTLSMLTDDNITVIPINAVVMSSAADQAMQSVLSGPCYSIGPVVPP